MSVCEVSGASLHYEMSGSGPVLVMITGATGSAYSFQPIKDHLAARFSVVTYDRRGFSRSKLEGTQDYDRRLETDAGDVRRLIEAVSDKPAFVFGNSSGALVALELLSRHPSAVRMLLPHEPPAMRLLPDGQEWIDFFHEVYDLWRDGLIELALKTFRERAFSPSDQQAMVDAPKKAGPEIVRLARANGAYWFEHELRQYPAAQLDLDALRAHASRIIPLAGEDSRGTVCHDATLALAADIGRDMVEVPGGHIGFLSRPAEFARALLEALERAMQATLER